MVTKSVPEGDRWPVAMATWATQAVLSFAVRITLERRETALAEAKAVRVVLGATPGVKSAKTMAVVVAVAVKAMVVATSAVRAATVVSEVKAMELASETKETAVASEA